MTKKLLLPTPWNTPSFPEGEGGYNQVTFNADNTFLWFTQYDSGQGVTQRGTYAYSGTMNLITFTLASTAPSSGIGILEEKETIGVSSDDK